MSSDGVTRNVRDRNDQEASGGGNAALSSCEFDLFAAVGRERPVRTGERLFRRGDTGEVMYVISHGRVELGEDEFQQLVARDPHLVAQFLRRSITRVVLNEQSLIRQLRRRNQDLETALDNLYATTHQLNQTEELIRTDELTGLYNRRGLTLHLQECRRLGMKEAMGLVLVDCDRFKQVNDDHGHLVGDRVLQNIAGILRSVAGPDDVPCRLGGDEFCLLVSAQKREDVMRYAEFVVATTRNLMQLQQAVPTICPVSVGACLVEPEQDWNDWYARADAALYESKRLGGNRAFWIDGLPPLPGG